MTYGLKRVEILSAQSSATLEHDRCDQERS
jgi:hypothetical protein